MTIINVEKQLFTPTREFTVSVECLTDNLEPITMGRIACILNRNILLDIKKVNKGRADFNIKIPDYLDEGNEYILRFSYSGSIQSDKKTTSSLVLFNKRYEQRIDAEIVVDDYYCKREETVNFKSYIKVPGNIQLSGKAVLKLDEQSIAHTVIQDNHANFEFTIPSMILDQHTLLWKYGTNEGIFVATSTLQLEPRVPVLQEEYHEDNGVCDQIRQTLSNPPENEENDSNSFTDRIRKLF